MENSRLHRNAAYFMSAQLLNRGAYAALLVTLTYLFGIGSITDIFFVAVTIPLMVVNITMDGCFVTVLRALSRSESEQSRWAVIGQSLFLFGTIYSLIAAIIGFSAPGLVDITAPGLSFASRTEAIDLLRIAVTMIPAQGVGQVVSSALIHRDQVAAGAWRPAVVSILSLCAALGGAAFFGARVGVFLSGMVLGVWIVNIGYLISLLKTKRGFGLQLRFRREIAAMFASALVNSGNNVPTNIALLVERAVATLIGPGALSAVNLARTCLNLVGAPASAVANSTFVEAMMVPGAENDGGLGRRRAAMLYGPLFIATPILVVLAIKSGTVVRFLFEHGHAGAMNSEIVARILVILVASFPFQICSTGMLRLYQSAYMEKMHLTVLSVGTAIYAAVAMSLGQRWGVEGLAGIYVVCFNFITIALAAGAAARLGRDVIALPWMRWIIATGISLGLVMFRTLLPSIPSVLPEILVDGLIALVAYVGAGWAVDLPGTRASLNLVFRWSVSRAHMNAAGRLK